MQSHVQKLAGDIGERNIWRYAELNSSADYIERILTDAGYKVGRQTYECEGKTVANLDATLAGGDPKLADEIVLVGAHYDSVKGCPGANDNATGVAGDWNWPDRWPKPSLRGRCGSPSSSMRSRRSSIRR